MKPCADNRPTGIEVSRRDTRRGVFCGLVALSVLATLTLYATDQDDVVVSLIQQGDSEVVQHHLKAALATFQKAERLAPGRADLLARISRQYGDLIEASASSVAARRCAEASFDYAKRAVKADSNNAQAHLALAMAYGRMTDYTSAKTKIEYSKLIKEEVVKSIAIDPTDDFAWHVLGRWNYGIADLNPMLRLMAKVVYGGVPAASMEEAVKCLKKATELAPGRIIHHRELAHAYQTSGQKDLAKAEWRKVLELPSSDKEDEDARREARESLR